MSPQFCLHGVCLFVLTLTAARRDEAIREAVRVAKGNDTQWRKTASEAYVSEAGWYFKTLAVQEIGELEVLPRLIDERRLKTRQHFMGLVVHLWYFLQLCFCPNMSKILINRTKYSKLISYSHSR